MMGWLWGSKQEKEAPSHQAPQKKICCACPETKVQIIDAVVLAAVLDLCKVIFHCASHLDASTCRGSATIAWLAMVRPILSQLKRS